jgi:hypothetical protein
MAVAGGGDTTAGTGIHGSSFIASMIGTAVAVAAKSISNQGP